jgi:molybdate transport system ATP-binding protein
MLKVVCSHVIPDGPRLEVSLEFGAEGLALHGPSGAGKSTLLHIIAGLCPPTRATITLAARTLFDSDTNTSVDPEGRHIGLVPQEPLLFPLHTVRDNLLFGRPSSPRLDPDHIISTLGLDSLLQRYPANLSGGERQRVAIGRSLISEPLALLVDEPFSALDPANRAQTANLLRESITELAIPFLLVTHRREDASELVAQHRLLVAGRIQPESAQS